MQLQIELLGERLAGLRQKFGACAGLVATHHFLDEHQARPASFVQRESRDQKTLDMLSVDPATGKSTILFTEKSGERSWLNLSDAYRPMRDGSLIWRSERDGYGHLYRFAHGKWTQLTKGPWVVQDLAGVDEAKGRLYFIGNKDGALDMDGVKNVLKLRAQFEGGTPAAPEKYIDLSYYQKALAGL